MEIDVQPIEGSGNLTCVAIDGRIDGYTVERVEEELNSLIRIGSNNLICDLSEVEFVSSPGFKAFRRLISFAREQDGDLVFTGLSAELGRLFSSVGFAKETRAFASVSEAVSGFEKTGESAGRNTDSGLVSNFRRIIGLDKEEEPVDDSALKQTQIISKESLKKTVVITESDSADDKVGRFAEVSPVKVSLYPDAALFQNVSQMLGTVGALAGFSTTGLVNLNVAVTELCRNMVRELKEDEMFTIEIDSSSPGFRVCVDIPRENYDVYKNLRPRSAEKSGKEWLMSYVDEVEISPSSSGTSVLLSLK